LGFGARPTRRPSLIAPRAASSSWLNMVERFFGKLDDKAIRRGILKSVRDLIAAIDAYLTATNQTPKPFVWTATADSLLAKVRRSRMTIDTVTN
jgi:hypothetical protein